MLIIGTITSNNTNGAMTKVLVNKNGRQQQYELAKGRNNVRVLLTLKNSTYSVIVCKGRMGKRYAVVTEKKRKLNLVPSWAAFEGKHVMSYFDSKVIG